MRNHNQYEDWSTNTLGVMGACFGGLLSFLALLILRVESERILSVLSLMGFGMGGLVGIWVSRKINAKQLHTGIGMVFCAVGKHWYGEYIKRDPPIGGFECLRCGFRPDGNHPQIPIVRSRGNVLTIRESAEHQKHYSNTQAWNDTAAYIALLDRHGVEDVPAFFKMFREMEAQRKSA